MSAAPVNHTSTRRCTSGPAERGAVLVLTALMLLPLMTFAAFSVDVASWYARVGELQKSADAAALAGTVWMPNFSKAKSVATDSLTRNRVVDGQDHVTVVIEEGSTATSLRVIVTDHRAARLFARLIPGDQALRRSAEAEYFLPLPLGSPLNYFGGDASKTAIPDTTQITVNWPNLYNSTSRPPSGPFACNVGTASSQGFGRWSSTTSYSATGYSGSTRCQWATLTSNSSAAPTTQLPINVPCNRDHANVLNLGRWDASVLGAVPVYNGLLRHAISPGNRQCTWTTPTSVPPDASTRSPANAPCNVTGEPATGSWKLVSGTPTFVASGLQNAGACEWTAGLVTTVIQTPNPIPANRNPGFWAQVEGPGTVTAYGDAFSTRCTSSLSCSGVESQQHRDTGYWYSIKIPASGVNPFAVSIFDAGFRRDGSITSATGDYNLGASSTTTNPDFITEYRVFQQTNPLDVTARVPVGTAPAANQTDNSCWWSVINQPQFQMQWRPLCTISPQPGSRYLLNVKTRDTGSARGAGLNGYAIQTISSGTAQPSLSAYSDMGMFNNGSGTFYLAEVDPVFAGRVLAIDLWDPGDVSTGTATIYPKMPSPSVPRPVLDVPATCTYTASPEPNAVNVTGGGWGSTGSRYPTAQPSDNPTKCAVNTAPTGQSQRFNDEWLRIRIQIPANYTCTPGINPETTAGSCWWGITYAFSAQPYDVTTWKARIEGNPVHLTN